MVKAAWKCFARIDSFNSFRETHTGQRLESRCLAEGRSHYLNVQTCFDRGSTVVERTKFTDPSVVESEDVDPGSLKNRGRISEPDFRSSNRYHSVALSDELLNLKTLCLFTS